MLFLAMRLLVSKSQHCRPTDEVTKGGMPSIRVLRQDPRSQQYLTLTYVQYAGAANQHGHAGISKRVAVRTKLVSGFPVNSQPISHTSFAMHVTVYLEQAEYASCLCHNLSAQQLQSTPAGTQPGVRLCRIDDLYRSCFQQRLLTTQSTRTSYHCDVHNTHVRKESGIRGVLQTYLRTQSVSEGHNRMIEA